MLIRQADAFYIETGGRRRGHYNARVSTNDVGNRDSSKTKAYRAESEAEKYFGARSTIINQPMKHYIVASIIDYIVTQPLFIEWFGSTHLLILFNQRRQCSRAWCGCIEFADHSQCGLAWFDVYHELAHHVTLRDDEPAHGERFVGAMMLIASLSPYPEHAERLAQQLKQQGIYPTSKYFNENYYN